MNVPVEHGPDALSMDATAKAAGLSRERFRKVWKTLMRDLKFPAPFKTPGPNGRGTYAWRESAVVAWKLAREAALGAAAPEAAPERRPVNDNPRIRPNPRLQQQREELARMMENT